MRSTMSIAASLAFLLTAGQTMAQERILISSEWGNISADLVDSAATRTLVEMLPLTIDMRDHLRQEKTGNLPSHLPEVTRQLDFSTGTLGLWGSDDFVLYYVGGQVPAPGIVILGKVVGDVSIFNRPVQSQSASNAAADGRFIRHVRGHKSRNPATIHSSCCGPFQDYIPGGIFSLIEKPL